MESLRSIREARGLSQRALARAAGLSHRGLQILESRGTGARVENLERLAKALGLAPQGLDRRIRSYLSQNPDSLAAASEKVIQDGFPSWKTHLFNAVDAFRREGKSVLIEESPHPDFDQRLGALWASSAEALSSERGRDPPAWTLAFGSLRQPWFVSELQNLRAMTLAQSPAWFRARNIFVLSNFLARA